MTELFHKEDEERLMHKRKAWTIATAVLGGALLTACIILNILMNTENSGRLLLAVLITSTAGGWVVIYFLLNKVFYYKRLAVHVKAMLEGERQRETGHFTVTDKKVRIKGSVAVRRVNREGRGLPSIDFVDEALAGRLAKKFAEIGGPVTVETVSHYIVAYGPAEEEAGS